MKHKNMKSLENMIKSSKKKEKRWYIISLEHWERTQRLTLYRWRSR